ncbi:SHOCT domain-containing protein [Anaerofustis stercorihominis]|uniref:SHOCT domain-containing protein n=1 Tax=Anaerofustis stercorihominis TaxID=214853 RepID=A0A3E3DX76_9FIRM|nr:SHOCT domain-containing protein [Anaerofustis stercorihominis]RGD73853.1 SHOCT domain-containing protein [Anaerofustis stercorihominis]
MKDMFKKAMSDFAQGMKEGVKESFTATEKPTENYMNAGDLTVDIDNKKFKFIYPNKWYNYEDLINYELMEGKTKIKSKSKKGIISTVGRATAGFMVAGPVGSVVGAGTGKKKGKSVSKTNLILRISINDEKNPSQKIKCKNEKRASDIMSLLDLILNNQNVQEQEEPNNPMEQIKQLKELFDIGAITQEEFDTKKKELLGL